MQGFEANNFKGAQYEFTNDFIDSCLVRLVMDGTVSKWQEMAQSINFILDNVLDQTIENLDIDQELID